MHDPVAVLHQRIHRRAVPEVADHHLFALTRRTDLDDIAEPQNPRQRLQPFARQCAEAAAGAGNEQSFEHETPFVDVARSFRSRR